MASSHVVWLNGMLVPAGEARLSIDDAAITAGATVTERLRTFRHEPFLLAAHLGRLYASARSAFIDPPLEKSELDEVVRETIARNAEIIPAEEDLSVSVWLSGGMDDRPTLCIDARPIPTARYACGYSAGLRLAVPATLAIDPGSLSPAIKTRNRLHWRIADRQADQIDSGASALLVDRNGFITETATANVFAVRDGRLFAPRRKRTLAGISQRYVFGLAEGIGAELAETDLMIEDFLHADEVLCSSSVFCLQPVFRINQQAIGDGRPGPVYQKLLAAWSREVGVDIAGQMQHGETS